MLTNTYVLKCAKKNQDKAYKTIYTNLGLISNFQPNNKSFSTIEDPDYRIDSLGHFYFSDSLDFYPYADSKKLLEKIEFSNPIDFLKNISGGLYSIWILDKKENKLYISTENFGATGIFIKEEKEEIYISNNQFAINQKCNFNESASIEFLTYGYLPYSDSLFEHTKRLAPYSIISIDLLELNIKIMKKDEFKYLSPDERFSDPRKILIDLKLAFDQYFKRIPKLKAFMGLSGGYDSRLIAAFLRDSKTSAIHYKNSNKAEQVSATKTSLYCKIPLRIEKFPDESPSRYSKNMSSQFSSISSFEYSHVLHLQENVKISSAHLYFDGYIGDTILGGTYFESKPKNMKFLFKYLFFQESKDESLPKDVIKWLDFVSDREILNWQDISDFASQEIIEKINKKKLLVLESLKGKVYTKEDLIEAWKHLTRARCMISMGPSGINQFIPACVPFLDNRIFSKCLNISKKLRSMDRIYNMFWNKYFPELARITKARTGSSPKFGNILFRLHHIWNSIGKKIYEKFAKPKDQYIDSNSYLSNEANMKLWMELKLPSSRIPKSIAQYLNENTIEELTKNPRLFLRLMSLQNYARLGD